MAFSYLTQLISSARSEDRRAVRSALVRGVSIELVV
jgi:hypothetical protein